MKQKRLISFLLTLCMILSMVSFPVFADADSITVNVSIAQNGKFVTGKNETKIAHTPITVADINENNIYDIDDVLYAVHELYYEGGAARGYASTGEGSSKFIKTLWGDTSGSFGFYANKQSAWSLSDEVANGDSVYAFIYQDTTGWSDTYSFFESNATEISGGEALKLKLQKNGYDQNYNTVVSDLPNATITVNESVTPYQTNENGEAELYFANSGTYIVSAVPKEGYIVPPVCVVTVTSDDENAENILSSDKESLALDETATVDLTLPLLANSKKTFIFWNTSDNTVISADGKVKRGDTEKTATLTATLKYGNYTDTKTFPITVPALSDSEIIDIAKNALTDNAPIVPDQWNSDYTDVGDTNVCTVVQRIVDSAVSGVTVLNEVVSENTAISNDGAITYSGQAKSGYVTFTLTKNNVSDTVKIEVNVPLKSETRQSVMDKAANELGAAILDKNTSLDNIVGNLNFTSLSDTLGYYIQAEWTVPDEYKDYLDRYGSVTRPAYGNNDITLKLSCKLSWYSLMESYIPSGYVGTVPTDKAVDYIITIKSYTEAEYNSAKSEVDDALKNFDSSNIQLFADNSVADTNNVKENLKLPAVSGDGFETVWSSNNEKYIKAPVYNTGRAEVTRPLAGENDTTVKLTITLSKNGYSNTKDFNVIVKALTNEEIEAEQAKIQAVADALTFDVIKNKNTQSTAVTTQLNLWRSCAYKNGQLEWSKSANVLTGYKIDWNYTDNVKEYGYIECSSEDVNVNLTANVYSTDKSSYTKPVEVKIPITIPSSEKAVYVEKVNGILDKIAATYKDSTDEWTVMDMGAYEKYAPETENKLTESAKQTFINSAIKTIQDATSDTAVDKAVLGLAAIDKNPELLYLVNSNTAISAIEKLNSVSKSTSAWSAPYTLAAYNQGDYDTDSYETEIVNTLLANQEEDGSWDEWGTIDTTANVIAGLSFYKDRAEVSTAIEKAVNYLSAQQAEDGTFSDGYSGSNANSTAMVIIGLAAAGVDLVNDPRFIKNGNNIIDGLLSFLVADGNGFGHTNNERINAGATEQSFRALSAFMQTVKTGGAYNVYDFSKNEFTHARATGSGSSSSVPAEPSGDNITVTMTIKADTGYWLKNYKVTIPGDDATVYHAFIKACSANSITHRGAANGYVSSITKGNKTLAEFDKGENSGWLYKVNGELPAVGHTDCKISDGDEIVWYYTEDWTKDPEAGHYGSSLNKKTENKTDCSSAVKTTTNVSGGTATVTATESSIKDAVSKAERSNNSSIVIYLSDTKDATDITLEIPSKSVQDIAVSGKLSLEIKTASGNVSISNETLCSIVEQIGTTDDVKVNIAIKTADEVLKNIAEEYAKTVAESVDEDILEEATVVEVTIIAGDKQVRSFGGHKLTVDIPIGTEAHEAGKYYTIYIVSADGKMDTTFGKCVCENGKKIIKIDTTHLSSFIVTDIEACPFDDVNNHWAYEAVKYVYNNSIMNGTQEAIFAPDENMTRAMLVTVLYRLENPEEKEKTHTFADVADGQWYTEAVAWAADCGVVNGVSETEFAPNDSITREQMAAIIYRYSKMKGYNTGDISDISDFTDVNEISEYALGAIKWANAANLVNGISKTCISPKATATRAQVAAILMRFCENVAK